MGNRAVLVQAADGRRADWPCLWPSRRRWCSVERGSKAAGAHLHDVAFRRRDHQRVLVLRGYQADDGRPVEQEGNVFVKLSFQLWEILAKLLRPAPEVK